MGSPGIFVGEESLALVRLSPRFCAVELRRCVTFASEWNARSAWRELPEENRNPKSNSVDRISGAQRLATASRVTMRAGAHVRAR